MPSLNDVPLATQTLAETQNPIRQNFLTLASTLSARGYTSNAIVQVGGWTRLPSGILLKWGRSVTSGTGATVITYPVSTGAGGVPDSEAIPAFSLVFSVVATVTSASNTKLYLSNTTNTLNFTATSPDAASVSFSYIAIGVE